MWPASPQEGPDRPITTGRGSLAATRASDGLAGAALVRVHRVALGVDSHRAALVLGALIALFGTLGALYRLGAPFALFDLDGEGKPPAAFSGVLLLCAGMLGWVIGDTASELAFRARWRAIGMLFLFMGIDEMLTIHESLADVAGVSWQLLYAPVGLLAGVIWLFVLRRLWRDRRERFLFICAPAAWLISQALEMVQNGPSDRVGGYDVMATAEESLEMIGSTLFLLALLITLQARGLRLSRRRPRTNLLFHKR